jgi:hypothetical protein
LLISVSTSIAVAIVYWYFIVKTCMWICNNSFWVTCSRRTIICLNFLFILLNTQEVKKLSNKSHKIPKRWSMVWHSNMGTQKVIIHSHVLLILQSLKFI